VLRTTVHQALHKITQRGTIERIASEERVVRWRLASEANSPPAFRILVDANQTRSETDAKDRRYRAPIPRMKSTTQC